jgi:pimeloyl-ACP methyl ester carboxylesterase/DNA-binding winged helix-turn-helix (wHTH) protein
MHDDEPTFELDGFRLYTRGGELRNAAGARIALRPQVMAVLQCLVRSADHVVDKNELMRAVWPGVVVTDDSLVQCVKELRRALGDHKHRLIQTEPKRGYRLVGLRAEPPAAVPFKQDIRFAASAGGTRIAYATSGSGLLTMVRAAHWMTHLEWDWQSPVYGPGIQGLSRRYRLVRYDGRGCGLSDRGVAMGTLDDEVGDLEAVVDAAGVDRFVLVGRSQGGAISIRYAARHPDRVSHLVLLGAYARGGLKRGPGSTPFEEVVAMMRLLEQGWGRDNPAFRQLLTTFMFPSANAEQITSFNWLQSVAATPQDAATLHRMMADYDAVGDLPNVRCPTLVMHSPRDCVVPFEEGRLIAKLITGARFESFDSPNHNALPGEPAFEHVMRAVNEFVSDTAAQSTPQRAPRTLRTVAG